MMSRSSYKEVQLFHITVGKEVSHLQGAFSGADYLTRLVLQAEALQDDKAADKLTTDEITLLDADVTVKMLTLQVKAMQEIE